MGSANPLKTVLPILGAGAGFLIGGPGGALIGLQAGSIIGGGFAANETARANSRLAKSDAARAREIARLNEIQFRKKGEALLSTQTALFGKAGVTFEGSPLEVMNTSAEEIELEALNIRMGGEARSRALIAESQISRQQGEDALIQSLFGGARSLLTAFQ